MQWIKNVKVDISPIICPTVGLIGLQCCDSSQTLWGKEKRKEKCVVTEMYKRSQNLTVCGSFL